ncbi:hypothetical protein [Streptomyces sp. NPDC002540]
MLLLRGQVPPPHLDGEGGAGNPLPIRHAAVVIAKSGSSVTIAQHTSKYRTSTMAAARSRNHPYSVWIAHVTPRW